MKFMLKVIENARGNEVFAKEKQGKGYAYLAKSESGEVRPVSKDWIIAHKGQIVNLGVSGDSIYPIKVTNVEKVECDYCGKLHTKNTLTPIYDSHGNETKKCLCKKCLADKAVWNYYDLTQCEECKRIFERVICCGYYTTQGFEIFTIADNRTDDISHLCSDCAENPKSKHIICGVCDEISDRPECHDSGICIRKRSSLSKRYACPKDCVQMLKDTNPEGLEAIKY